MALEASRRALSGICGYGDENSARNYTRARLSGAELLDAETMRELDAAEQWLWG